MSEDRAASQVAYWQQLWLWWERIGAPLRPSGEDLDIIQRLVAESGAPEPRAVLLGVTPELATMAWPAGTRLLAVDRSQGMIDHVWPKTPFPGARALCGEWTQLPVGDGECDVVVGDGCFSQLQYPHGYDALVRELHRALRAQGSFAMRAFVRPERPEAVSAIFDDLNAGRIGSFHVFKWRLNMALQPDLSSGVRLADVWDAFHQAFPQPGELAAKRGWPLHIVEGIDAYRDVSARYTFPTLGELRDALSPLFSEVACVVPRYEMGDRCPTLLFSAR